MRGEAGRTVVRAALATLLPGLPDGGVDAAETEASDVLAEAETIEEGLGVRMRGRLMHDLASLTLEDAIQRHRGEASGAARGFQALRPDAQRQLITFLRSL